MQKLITFKTANEALYIGRLLPKNRENEKSAKIEAYLSLQDKNTKTILIAVRRKKFKTKENL